jgi:hypothetical protein
LVWCRKFLQSGSFKAVPASWAKALCAALLLKLLCNDEMRSQGLCVANLF